MTTKFKSRSRFPMLKLVSNILQASPRHHDHTTNLRKGLVKHKAKWYFINADLAAKAIDAVNKKYPDAEIHYYNSQYSYSQVVVHWQTTVAQEMKAARKAEAK